MDRMSELIIGIDRGASFTDFAVVRERILVDHLSIETRNWSDISAALEEIQGKYPSAKIAFSGAATDMPEDLNKQVIGIPEIESIGLGGAALADCETCLVISMGTGSAMVYVDQGAAKHVGGTGVGGGTIKGLATLICGTDNVHRVEELALKGSATGMNMTIGDLGLGDLSFLSADATVSNFAGIKSDSMEDKAAGILSLVAETIGIIASLCALHAGCVDNIVAVGKVSTNRHIRETLERVGVLYQTRFLFPEHAGCATAYGAALKYLDLHEI
jgi:type II pantothenate kinase